MKNRCAVVVGLKIHVGCCGWAGFSIPHYPFKVVEIQSTFYRLPKEETAARWRREAPNGLRITLKAFQGLTHPYSSHTWKKAGSQRPVNNVDKYGHLRPTEENFLSWSNTLRISKILQAEACVVQLPPSFTATDENIANAVRFFESAERGPTLCLELRHRSWLEAPEKTKSLMLRIGAADVTDPLVRRPLTEGTAHYFRLHGRGKRLYKYRYFDEDLLGLMMSVLGIGGEECYVMLNNLSMAEDAQRFISLLSQRYRGV